MNIREIEKQTAALPYYQDKPSSAVIKAVALLAIAKLGPKIDALAKETGYEPNYLYDRIEWLKQNQQLAAGSLSRKYVENYFPGGHSIIDAYLGSTNGNGAAPKPKAAPSSGVPDNLNELTLEEVRALWKSRGEGTNYQKMSRDGRRIYNRLTALRNGTTRPGKASKPSPKANTAPAARQAPAHTAKPPKPEPERPPVNILQMIAHLESQVETINADIAALKHTYELINEIELPAADDLPEGFGE